MLDDANASWVIINPRALWSTYAGLDTRVEAVLLDGIAAALEVALNNAVLVLAEVELENVSLFSLVDLIGVHLVAALADVDLDGLGADLNGEHGERGGLEERELHVGRWCLRKVIRRD